MVLEHVGMPQPGDCRVVFSASAEELEAAIQAEQAAENPPQTEEDLLTAAVNRAILTGFSTLYQEIVEKEHLVPVTDPDFELLAVNRAEGFRAGAEFYCRAAAGAGTLHRLHPAHPAPAHPSGEH